MISPLQAFVINNHYSAGLASSAGEIPSFQDCIVFSFVLVARLKRLTKFS